MRLHMLVFALVSFHGMSAMAHALGGEIEDALKSHIEAVMADDFERAFTFISPDSQEIFGSPEDFGALMREGYPMIHRPKKYELLDLKESGGATWQRVRFTDEAGANWLVDFKMLQTPEGWTIDGVMMLPDSSGGH